MNVKSFVPLIAGLCIGGLALKIGISTLQRAKGAPSATIELWAPAADIPRGTLITDDMLKAVQFPKDLVPGGAVREKDKLVARVPRVDAPAGLPILDPMLLPPGSPAGVHVPAGLRAVAVKVDEGSGVDFHLEPGSRVDVIGYFQNQEGNKRETIARTLIEDVEVAAVGARISAVSAEGESKSSANRPARAVTLFVKPDNVPILHLAEQRGKVKLSMRSADDTQAIGQTRTVSDAELLGEPAPVAEEKPKEEREPVMGWLNGLFARPASATTQPSVAAVAEPARPEPAPQPPGEPPWVVQVYRGNQVETIQFQNRNSRERVQTQDQKKPGSYVTATAKTPPVHAGPPAAAPATASPGKPVSTATPESAGGEPNVNTESETNAQDQVPQEPSE